MYYVQLSATGLFAGTGQYHMAADQLERFRAAVDDDRSGREVERHRRRRWRRRATTWPPTTS